MKRILHHIVLCTLFISAIACSSENDLTPSGSREDYFTIPADATDEVSLLRKAFFEQHNVHVLFNDTLRSEQKGTNSDGTPRYYTETIDLNWNMVTHTSEDYRWEYLNEEDYRTAMNFCSEYLLPHLGKTLRPYSILLLKDLYSVNSSGRRTDLAFVSNFRCLAINVGSIIGADEDVKKNTYIAICQSIVIEKLKDMDDALAEFEAVSEEYYWAYYEDFYEDFADAYAEYRECRYEWWDAEDVYAEAEEGYGNGELSEEEWKEAQQVYQEAEESWNAVLEEHTDYCWNIAHECGFLRVSLNGYFPSYLSYDIDDYVPFVFSTTEEELEETYADYPKIIEKYHILKKVISEIGFVF